MQLARPWRGVMAATNDQDANRSISGLSDAEVVQRARADIGQFAPIYERYAGHIHLYCYRRLGNAEDAADATSLVFTRALAAIGRFSPDPSRPGSTVRAWLFTIARNVVIDRVRRARPQVSLDAGELAWSLADRDESPEAQAIRIEEARSLGEHLAVLPERQLAVVELRLADLTLAEICTTLSLSEPAVKSLQFRAFRTLRTSFRERTP